MNENENNVMTEMTNNEPEMTNDGSGIGTGLAMLIGSGLTIAAVAVGKKLKKVYDNRKANKRAKKDIEGTDVIDLTDEDIYGDSNK